MKSHLRLLGLLALLVLGGLAVQVLARSQESTSFSVGYWLTCLAHPLPFLAGLGYALLREGGGAVRGAGRVLVGLDERTDLVGARDALRSMARGMLGFALLQGLLVIATMTAGLGRPDGNPLGWSIETVLYTPVLVLITTRLFLGPLAEHVSDGAGADDWVAFRPLDEWMSFAQLLPWLAFLYFGTFRYVA